jgi:signal transduction histidine kinase
MKVWLGQRWVTIWHVIGSVSLHVKIVGVGLAMIIIMGLGLSWQVRATTRRVLSDELEQRGISMANELARESASLLADRNVAALTALVQNTVRDHAEVQYAFVLDDQGRAVTDSFDSQLPTALVQANAVQRTEPYRATIVRAAEGQWLDVAVPIAGGYAGTARVGMSLQSLDVSQAGVTCGFMLTALLVSLLAIGIGMGLTWLLTRPMLTLAQALTRAADGDLDQRIVPWAEDEIGQAQVSFNAMVERLARLRQETEQSNLRLLRHNRELSALYAISVAVAGPLQLTEVLEKALQLVVSLVHASGGWICLLGQDDSCEVCVRSPELLQANIGLDYCRSCTLCREVVGTRRTLTIVPLPPECPLRVIRDGVGHAIVPLLVRDRAVGLLNLICQENGFEPADLVLLTSLGRQLGVAIENARLWEELRHKEAVRGQLLRKIIMVQEEERQRIARELHDEAGQALTSLLIGLRAIERAGDLAQVHALSSDLRQVVTQTLDEVHDLAVELRPSVLDDLGLVPALKRYVSSCLARFGFEADFVTTGVDNQRLPQELETTLYRIAQEALTNVARHAKASHASVLLQRRKGTVVLVVEDNGVGFDVSEAMASSRERERLGLYGIEERASLIGGRLTVESRPGG